MKQPTPKAAHGSKHQRGEDTKDRAEEKIGSGKKGGKLIVQPTQGSNENSLTKRGMTSEEGAKHWKEGGFKVPTDVHGHHHPGK